jgi:hypothetical protein
MEEVLDVYAGPYNPNKPVACVDEPPKQLISGCRIPFENSKGAAYTDYEYKRGGTVDLYMAAEPSGEGVKCWLKINTPALDGLEQLLIQQKNVSIC